MSSENTTITVETRRCIRCGEKSLIEVTYGDYLRWIDGTHVQVIWPHWSAEKRELLITGTHPACWDAIFGGDAA